MERNLLLREINDISPNRDSEFGNPNRSPSGTLDDQVVISWENKEFAQRDDGIKRVYAVANGLDGRPRKASFRINVNNTGSSKYAFFNRFFIARLFYETASGQDSDCRASKGMNCIAWEDGKFLKKISIPHDPNAVLVAVMSDQKKETKSITDVYIDISETSLSAAYAKVENQILNAQKTADGRTLDGKLYLEITFYWQEFKRGFWSGTFLSFQSKPIKMLFFPVKSTYFFFPDKRVPTSKLLAERIKKFKDKYTRQVGQGVSTSTHVSLQIGQIKKNEVSTGGTKSMEIKSEVKSTTETGLKAEVTIPIIDFIKWEGSTSKTTEETEGIVNSYTASENLMKGIETSLQQTIDYPPMPKKGKKRRFYMVPVVEPVFVKSVIFTPVNRFGFATTRIARKEEEIFLTITGWDIEERFEK